MSSGSGTARSSTHCPGDASFLRKAMALDLAVYLPGLGLAYNDRASMEHGVEVRVPWLDLDLVRWSLTLPDSVLIRNRCGPSGSPRNSPPALSRRRSRGGPSAALPPQPGAWRQGGYPAARASARDGTLHWPRPSSSSMAWCRPTSSPYFRASIRRASRAVEAGKSAATRRCGRCPRTSPCDQAVRLHAVAMVHLMRDYRAGKLKLFTAARKPVTAGATSAKERPRHRAIQLRLLSTYEISARLAVEGKSTSLPDSVLIRKRRTKWLHKEFTACVIVKQEAQQAKLGSGHSRNTPEA